MTNKSSDIDEFKRALTMAMRSISKQDELTVSFGSDKGNLSGLKARLPMPNKNMDSLTTAYLLGAKVLEKHFTINKKKVGNDHYHSMDYLDLLKLNFIKF